MEPKELLTDGLRELGLEPSDAQVEKLLGYLSELKRWSKAYSLTSLKTDRDIIVKHFLDSALYLKVIPSEVKSIADIGAGAGFPGVVLKILRPELEVTLIEPVQKKDTFLRNLISRLKLEGISTLRARVEDVSDIQVDAACTRALFSVEELVEKAGHIVRPGGLFILSKGPKGKDELGEGDEAGIVYKEIKVELPIEKVIRHLITIKK